MSGLKTSLKKLKISKRENPDLKELYLKKFKEKVDLEIFEVSAAKNEGLQDVADYLAELIESMPNTFIEETANDYATVYSDSDCSNLVENDENAPKVKPNSTGKPNCVIPLAFRFWNVACMRIVC